MILVGQNLASEFKGSICPQTAAVEPDFSRNECIIEMKCIISRSSVW